MISRDACTAELTMTKLSIHATGGHFCDVSDRYCCESSFLPRSYFHDKLHNFHISHMYKPPLYYDVRYSCPRNKICVCGQIYLKVSSRREILGLKSEKFREQIEICLKFKKSVTYTCIREKHLKIREFNNVVPASYTILHTRHLTQRARSLSVLLANDAPLSFFLCSIWK